MIFPHPMLATAGPKACTRAFTLVEVMVSIAVALILLLGVNQVFHATALTTGTGLALSTSQQMSRTVKATLQNDLKNGAWDTGILIIRNEQVYAFRNIADQQSAADPNDPTKVDPQILNAFGQTAKLSYPNGIYPAYGVNSRSHRVDRIGFFARGQFDRQTSPGPLDTIPVQCNEAWVWYGHLSLPDNAVLKGTTRDAWIDPPAGAAYFGPGAPNANNAVNDNNFFATDWALGRFATLMIGPEPLKTLAMNPDYLRFDFGTSYATPLTYDTRSAQVSGGSPEFGYKSLHDVAADSIAYFTARLSQDVSAVNPVVIPGDGVPWYYSMIGVEAQQGQPATDHRYQASPFIPSVGLDGAPNSSRLSPTSLALAAPIIARGCCHFIVEYAGNYLTQTDTPGTVNANNQQDGTVVSPTPSPNPDHIDFVSVYDATTNQYVRKIRWYGYPRDTNGVPGIQYDDVMPLRDVLALNNDAAYQPPFEHFGIGFPNAPSAGAVQISGTTMDSTSNRLTQYDTLGSQPDYTYTCAWGPYPALNPPPGWASWPVYGLPKLLRITVVFDDPNGRLGSEQSYEYIIDLRN